MSDEHQAKGVDKIEFSAIVTVGFIGLLLVMALIVTLWAPRFVDPTWTEPSSYYQTQMYEVADPSLYISRSVTGGDVLQFVHHLKNGQSVLSFQETNTLRIIAPEELKHFITPLGEERLRLTSRLLFLRPPAVSDSFDALLAEKSLRERLREDDPSIDYQIAELYDPKLPEGFAVAQTDGVEERFISENFVFLDANPDLPFHNDPGLIYVSNPQEYRISPFRLRDKTGWRYNPAGKAVAGIQELTQDLGFRSRKELIDEGEHIFAIEGCWYCHTDQTRTLVQDVVLNGSDSYPAPPSSPNEYIYQRVTFPGTRRIGPDLSRVAIKRPGRDWHISHFWSPQTKSQGSIMPPFRHFFDDDPSGTSQSDVGVPNFQFEAVYQYLMTKGSRITPPTQAWWLGKDPVQTRELIQSRKGE